MKKLTSLLLTATLALSTLTACSSASAGSDPNTAAAPNAADNASITDNTAPTSDATPTTLDQIKANGYITFATEGTYAPYSYHDESDNLVGFDVEVAQAVAEKLGVEARFTETQWDGIIAGLDAQKYDAIANQVSITEERQEKYLFSTPYTYAYGAVVVNGDNTDINSFEDLNGKDVALTVTSNWAQVAESYGGTIVSTNGFSESIQLVIQGRADATVNDNVTFLDFKANQPDANVKIVAISDEATQSAILLRKDDAALQEAINTALAELQAEGKLTEISIKYFGEDITTNK
ncbi:amino acid ABC transporter substrate-binding protein, PAAT family [Butyrivibrio fibrisolvens]|uniref:Amino acid ABC transporter substrate-binding protein, PAAT family n=1 Tax=Butyrivibrio fibrisolvens TaxID=831 RepID=A0A1H9XCP2_BUTFI|nr:amino acid ABC transporter substrate-binding protein [Butyrivibrio fibrisolvens]SES43894.1 amino acid ABC transporter substrate-binding protein, PAAT family [Butyrivibrio fibrisolvens]